MTVGFRPGLELVPVYQQGKAPAGTANSFKLSSNENPYDPLPSVRTAVQEALGTFNLYPDMAAAGLVERLAARFGVQPENIALGAGSVEVAAQIIHAVAGPGDEVVFAWRSFEAYPGLVRVSGAVPVQVPLDGEARHDLDAMAEAITGRTRVVFICNPNNPTGTVVSSEELEAFMAKVPANVLVVIDEAYLHFNLSGSTAVGIDFFRSYPNVAVLHTFSKAYGLAGLRLGYAIAQPEVATNLRKAAVPFGVTSLAQAAGLASLDAEDELQLRIEALHSNRAWLQAELGAAGLPVIESQANFIWAATGADTARITAVLESCGITVRSFGGEGIRISVGTQEANRAVVAAVRQALGQEVPA